MAHDEDLDNKIAWIEAELLNNETADDYDLAHYFRMNGLDEHNISLIMAQRSKALREISFSLDLKGMKL